MYQSCKAFLPLILGLFLTIPSLSHSAQLCATSTQISNLEGEEFLGRKFLRPAGRLTKTYISHKGQSADTVDFVSSKKGSFDLVYELKKVQSWESFESAPDVQGNLLMSIESWGPYLSEKLGFMKIRDDTIQYPSAAEFIHRYRRLKVASKKNRAFFQVDFYSPQKGLSSITYLYRFAFHGQLPIATKNRTMLHDLNWHTLSPNLLPPILVQQLRQKIQILFLYIHDFSKNVDLNEESLLNAKAELDIISTRLDYILGQGIYLIKYPKSHHFSKINFSKYFSEDPYALVRSLDFANEFSNSFLKKYNFPSKHQAFDHTTITDTIESRYHQLLELENR